MPHLLQRFLRPGPKAISQERGDGPNRMTFLGTAGFVLEFSGRTLVLDPYLSRPGLLQTFFGRLRPKEDLLAREIPRADEVLVGHSHYDHALDAPAVCRITGARLLGSAATLHIARAYGLPESQLLEVRAGESQACGPVTATPLRSRHGKAFLGKIPFPGDISSPPPWPPRIADLRHGPVFLWHLEAAGLRILHVDSADYSEEDLKPADILCLCAIGRAWRPDYTRGIIARTGAKLVIPCHWDDFSLPWGTPARQLPGVDLEGFVEEIRAAGAEPMVLGLGERLRF